MSAKRFESAPEYEVDPEKLKHLKHILTGRKFGKLSVLGFGGKIGGQSKWVCRCECGYYTLSFGFSLTAGTSRSCGCIAADAAKVRWANATEDMRFARSAKAANATHRKSKHPLFRVWTDMRQRCLNPNNKFYPLYGGRGIRICDEWFDFARFYSEMSEGYQKGRQIGRIDNERGYSKSNCRWETPKQQQRNKTNTRYVETPIGKMQVSEAAEAFGLSAPCILHRISAGWDAERTFFTPSQRGKK
jgi:hypothetical protein